jgi:hypothetical protein
MSIEHQRVVQLCDELRLDGVVAQYNPLAQKATDKGHFGYGLRRRLLVAERESRRARARNVHADGRLYVDHNP